MSIVEEADNASAWTGRLTPSEVHNAVFGRAGLGRRGYDEGEVDFFLERVESELARLVGEKADLRDEAERLRSQLASAEGSGTARRDEASAQAVRILSAAQQTADQYVAEAEHYSRRMSVEARESCERMIEEARQRSQEILDEAERLAAESQARLAEASAVIDAADGAGDDAPTEDAKRELEEQVTYLRTFSEVCRVQLRAYLEALLRDIEDEWGRAHPQVVESLARRQEPAAVLSLHAAGANDQPDGAGLADGERAAAEPRYGKPQVAYQDAYQDDEDGPADDDADRSEYGVEYDQYGVQYNAQFDAETDADDDDPDDEQPAPRHLSVTIPDCRMPTVSQLR